MLLLHFRFCLVLLQEKLLDILGEVQFLLFLGLFKVFSTLGVGNRLVLVLLFLHLEFLLVQVDQVALLLEGLLVHLLLLHGQLPGDVLILCVLLFNLLFQFSDFLVVLRHRLLELHITSFLLQIDVGLECLDSHIDLVK